MRPDSRPFPAIALALAVATTSAAANPDDDEHAKYSVVEITLPSAPDCIPGFWHATVARRLNERGEVVGDTVCDVATGDEAFPILIGGSDAFRWNRAAGATMLPSFAADRVDLYARDINESGTAIGWEFEADGGARAPVWPRAGGISLAVEPQGCPFLGLFSLGEGINDRGALLSRDARTTATGACSIVWILKLASGEEFVGPIGTPRQLNNNGLAVGQSGNRAMRWSPAGGEVVLYQDPTGQRSGFAWSINDRNEAVGRFTHIDEQFCAVSETATFWAANARQTILARLRGDTHASAFGINNRSQVVGQSYTLPSCTEYDQALSRAVIWKGTRAVDLNSLVPQRFAREFHLETGSAINDRGQIVARGIRRHERRVPCPQIESDPETGENVYNPSVTCHNLYSFLLTPQH